MRTSVPPLFLGFLMKLVYWLLIGLSIVALFAIIWFLIDFYAVTTTLKTGKNCGEERANTPAYWIVAGKERGPSEKDFNAKPWYIKEYDTVKFPSRQPKTTISAWWTPTAKSSPAIIVIHGIGTDNGKCNANSLLPSAMLYKAGFNVLNIDLSGYNQSSHHNKYVHLGQSEYLDILGAVDWLNKKQHIPVNRIGLFGYSLGAFTAALAFAKDEHIAALWLDTPFVNFRRQAADEFAKLGLPRWMSLGVIPLANWLTGANLTKYNGIKMALISDHHRPIFLTHAIDDPRINISHSQEILRLAKRHANIQHWFVNGVNTHVAAMFVKTTQYQKHLITFFTRAFKHNQ